MKPRNHLVKQALFRKAGSHKKSEKALRKKEKSFEELNKYVYND